MLFDKNRQNILIQHLRLAAFSLHPETARQFFSRLRQRPAYRLAQEPAVILLQRIEKSEYYPLKDGMTIVPFPEKVGKELRLMKQFHVGKPVQNLPGIIRIKCKMTFPVTKLRMVPVDASLAALYDPAVRGLQPSISEHLLPEGQKRQSLRVLRT